MTNDGAPGAGWYPDPSNPAQERWWGGVEWTHDVRPLAAPAAPAPAAPALSDVPGGGVNPFAEIDRQQASADAAEAAVALSPVDSSSGYSGAQVDFAPAFGGSGAARYDVPPRFAPGPPPRNGFAVAGLVLSLLGGYLLGIIFSIIGLVTAKRLARSGREPRGRVIATWGLVIGLVAPIALTAIAVPVYLQAKDRAKQEVIAVANANGVTPSEVVIELNGRPAVYDRASYEQAFSESFAEGAGDAPDWVTCPDSVALIIGAQITCQFAFHNVNHVATYTFTDIHGGGDTQVDGVPVQE